MPRRFLTLPDILEVNRSCLPPLYLSCPHFSFRPYGTELCGPFSLEKQDQQAVFLTLGMVDPADGAQGTLSNPKLVTPFTPGHTIFSISITFNFIHLKLENGSKSV